MQVPLYELDDELVIVSPTGTTCPFLTPTSVILDAWRQVVLTSQTGAGHGGNVSCAIVDDVSLGLGESELDTELTICSVGNEADPTFVNVEAQITGLRDKNKADTGVFNLFTWLNVGIDTRYGWVDRIGYPSNGAFASGQIISIYDALNDVPLDIKEDRGNLKLQQNPTPSGNVLTLHTLGS
jgi:hypothetical protein